MTANRIWALVVIVLVLGFGGFGLASATQALKGRPTSVAVCDVQRAFDNLKEKAQIEADLQVRAQRLQQEKQDREKEIQALQSDLSILAPDTPAYEQKQAEMEKKAIELQAWAAYENNKMNRERATQIEHLYRRLIEAIGRVAKENGFDVVLFEESEINFRGAKPEQLSPLIQMRKVLFAAEDLDLTDLVLTKMNNEFVNRAQ